MEPQNIALKIKGLAELIPRQDMEKFVFKMLLFAWGIIIILIAMKVFLGPRDYIKRRILNAATVVKKGSMEQADIAKYESVFSLVKYPEAIDVYSQKVTRDPFSEQKHEAETKDVVTSERDFVILSIERIPLPMVYKGYIELPDKIIGQVNWHEATKFVNHGSVIYEYKIERILKDRLIASDKNGARIEFNLNKPVLTDKLEAVLYDNVSLETYSVRLSSQLEGYKIVEITPNSVVLKNEGIETMLEKK
ncbi:MAG: hypothetical protein ISS26_03315 [Candidatus Omnitrophica bacterium]|nr:hypothetical protein [Candidatus Omnitrophota bacterium]